MYGLTGFLSVIIPDIPSGVRTQIQREKLLAREVLFETELNEDKTQKRANKIEAATVNLSDESRVLNSGNGLRNRNIESVDLEENLDDVY